MTRHRSDRAGMILLAISNFRAANGYAPTVREIAERVGLASPAAVQHHIRKLREAGLLEPTYGRARALVAVRGPEGLTADALELAYCQATHGQRPPKVRPCKRHRLAAEFWAEIVIPRVLAAQAQR